MGLVFFIWLVQYRGDNVFRFCRFARYAMKRTGLWNICACTWHLKGNKA